MLLRPGDGAESNGSEVTVVWVLRYGVPGSEVDGTDSNYIKAFRQD